MAMFDIREWPSGKSVSVGISATSFPKAIEKFAGKSVARIQGAKQMGCTDILYTKNYKIITTIGGDQYSVHKRVKSWTD